MNTNSLNNILRILACFLCASVGPAPLSAAGGSLIARSGAKLVDDAIEASIRVSGRGFSHEASQRAAREALEAAVARYGDDALQAARHGGVELFEAAARHGDDVLSLAARTTPDGARALATRSDELLPLARRYGPDFLTLEGRAPGLASRAVQQFGSENITYLARNVPADDLAKLVGYAEKADSPATRRLLLETYKREGSSIFQKIPPKLVLSGGVSAAMITAAYQLSKTPGDWMNDPENKLLAALLIGFLGLSGISFAGLILLMVLHRFGLVSSLRTRSKTEPATSHSDVHV
jgi:hypothetical protein